MTSHARPALAAALLLASASVSLAQLDDANSLYGIHWYGNTGDAGLAANPTDAENMAPGREMWVLEITHVDDVSPDPDPATNGIQAVPWVRPGYMVNHAGRVTGAGKNHSLVFRIQPNWSRQVPYYEGPGDPDNDPMDLATFADRAKSAAQTMVNTCRIWQVGNEVNLVGENNRWNSVAARYNIPWTPTPAQYAATFLAVRDKIHEVVPNMTPAQQIVLIQPNSPGNADGSVRFMDGNEYLWRTLEAMSPADLAKVDGFGLHSYAEPGGTNDGVDGFMDALREQIMIADQFGLHDRPLLVTEFNKHMPDSPNTTIGARFVQKAFQALNDWNNGVGGAFEGVANHDVAGAMWFIFMNDGGWADYSLQGKKASVVSTDPNVNPWYGFQAAAAQNYARGSMTGGGAVDSADVWLSDDFATLDTTAPLPDWKVETTGGGSASASGTGSVRLVGTGTDGGATLRSAGYVYGDFRMELDFEITNSLIPSGSANSAEANFDIRVREGSQGYSLTFFTDASDVSRRNRVILRRSNVWTQIGSFNQSIGIATGDKFRVVVVATPAGLQYDIWKNGGASPVVTWTVNDTAQRVGWVRMGTYNMREARVDNIVLGGPDWTGTPSSVGGWELH